MLVIQCAPYINTAGLAMRDGWIQGHRLQKELNGVIVINERARLSLSFTSTVFECVCVHIYCMSVCPRQVELQG